MKLILNLLKQTIDGDAPQILVPSRRSRRSAGLLHGRRRNHSTIRDDPFSRVAVTVGAAMPKAIPLNMATLLSAWQTFRFKLGGPEPKVTDSAIAVMSLGQFIDGQNAR
jgi:hypothetical protein